jgi:hypothetical protein
VAFAAPAALVLGALGSAVSAVGAISAGESQAAAANYQAQVAKNNATIAAQNAEYAIQAGQAKATDLGLQQRAQQAAVVSAIAANNVDINTGSAADVRIGQRQIGYLDTQRTVEQAALTAYGYRSQQTGFEAEAGLETAQAGFDTTAGFIGGAGDLLSGAGNVGSNYVKYFQNTGGSNANPWNDVAP